MNPSEHNKAEPAPQPTQPQVSVPSRRKLLKGGIAAPLIATLASRPVLAATVCAAPSGFNSAGSGLATRPLCNGADAAFWLQNPGNWPSPYVAAVSGNMRLARLGPSHLVTPGTLFHSNETGFRGSVFAGKPISEVLQGPDSGLYGLGKYCAVAMLNAASGRTPVLNETGVRNLWNEYINRGYYEPTAGVKWDDHQIIKYIRSTIG